MLRLKTVVSTQNGVLSWENSQFPRYDCLTPIEHTFEPQYRHNRYWETKILLRIPKTLGLIEF